MSYDSCRGFHLANGLFFERMENGKIEIRFVPPPHHPMAPVLLRVETDADGLASVMASMSVHGETGETFAAARKFLLGLP